MHKVIQLIANRRLNGSSGSSTSISNLGQKHLRLSNSSSRRPIKVGMVQHVLKVIIVGVLEAVRIEADGDGLGALLVVAMV